MLTYFLTQPRFWLATSGFLRLCGQNSKKRNDFTSILVDDFRLKLNSFKRSSKKFIFFISIKKSYWILKFMALLHFVQISIWSRSSYHNRTQITLKRKLAFQAWWILLFLVHSPILSSKDDVCFRYEFGSAHVKLDAWTGPYSHTLELTTWPCSCCMASYYPIR